MASHSGRGEGSLPSSSQTPQNRGAPYRRRRRKKRLKCLIRLPPRHPLCYAETAMNASVTLPLEGSGKGENEPTMLLKTRELKRYRASPDLDSRSGARARAAEAIRASNRGGEECIGGKRLRGGMNGGGDFRESRRRGRILHFA